MTRQLGEVHVGGWYEGTFYSNRRVRIVLDSASDLPGALLTGKTADKVQCHVDPSRDARGRDHLARVHPTARRSQLDRGVELFEKAELLPICRGRPAVQDAGGGKDQGTSTHAGHQCPLIPTAADPIEHRRIVQQRAGALAARQDQDVKRWHVCPTMHGTYHETLGALDVSGSSREGHDLPSVFWVITRPVGKDFPRPDGVELFDASEQHDADCAHNAPR